MRADSVGCFFISISLAPAPAATERRASATGHDFLWFLWGVVDQQRVERQRVGQDVVADGVAADRQGVEEHGLALDGHLDGLEVCVHEHVNADDGALHQSLVFELHGDGLVGALCQEARQFHGRNYKSKSHFV